MASLCSRLPGTKGRDPSRSAKASCLRSSRSLALRWPSSGPWQAKQCRARIGRTSRVKRTGFWSVNRGSGSGPTRASASYMKLRETVKHATMISNPLVMVNSVRNRGRDGMVVLRLAMTARGAGNPLPRWRGPVASNSDPIIADAQAGGQLAFVQPLENLRLSVVRFGAGSSCKEK